MPERSCSVARRDVLQATGGAVAAVGSTGPVSAGPGNGVTVNVGFRDESGRVAALDAARSRLYEFPFGAVTVRLPEPEAEALAARTDVRYVEANAQVHALGQIEPWGFDRIDADVVAGAGQTARGVDVAILDTGIDSDHPDLRANLGDGTAVVDCRGNPHRRCREPWDDDNGHGTLSAGVVGAVDNDVGIIGVSTEVTLHAVKVLDRRGVGSVADLAAGIQAVADRGWDVANLSLGGPPSQLVRDAGSYAAQQGVLLVAAAGNDGPCSDCVAYPAAYPEFVAVGAIGRDDDLAPFGSEGPEIELVAPGLDVPSTLPAGYGSYSGTSMAAPHVTGAAAHLLADGLTATETRTTLTESAEDLGLAPTEQGAGLVDVAAALGLDSSDDG